MGANFCSVVREPNRPLIVNWTPTQLDDLMRRNFVDYASYAILDRAIPDLRDGLKPVQRRILHTLFQMNDGRYHKVANVIGETMKLHPHGDASIGDALVVLANKGFFIDRQGNFGNLVTGQNQNAGTSSSSTASAALARFEMSASCARSEPTLVTSWATIRWCSMSTAA